VSGLDWGEVEWSGVGWSGVKMSGLLGYEKLWTGSIIKISVKKRTTDIQLKKEPQII
jgi:hypothetical protein